MLPGISGDRQPTFRDGILRVFGLRQRVRISNDVFSLLESSSAKGIPLFYLACGSADDFLPVNREFTAQLASRGAVYEYHETPGGHEWELGPCSSGSVAGSHWRYIRSP